MWSPQLMSCSDHYPEENREMPRSSSEPNRPPADIAIENEQLSDGDFFRQLRADVEGVREGLVPSIADLMRPALKDRPWSPRRKRRDRHGKAF